MRLQDELDLERDRCFKSTPPHIRCIRAEAINDLISSGIAEKAVKAGDCAPEFALRNADGKKISSCAILASNPILVAFYRGGWCPYCKLDLRAIESIARELQSSGVSVLAISQQSPQQSRATERMNGLSFPSLVDRGGRIARAFGLRWNLSRELRAAELEAGLDLASVNGDSSWTLTMPALYVINQAGIIEYADVSADYTRRCDPLDLFSIFRHICARQAH